MYLIISFDFLASAANSLDFLDKVPPLAEVLHEIDDARSDERHRGIMPSCNVSAIYDKTCAFAERLG